MFKFPNFWSYNNEFDISDQLSPTILCIYLLVIFKEKLMTTKNPTKNMGKRWNDEKKWGKWWYPLFKGLIIEGTIPRVPTFFL